MPSLELTPLGWVHISAAMVHSMGFSAFLYTGSDATQVQISTWIRTWTVPKDTLNPFSIWTTGHVWTGSIGSRSLLPVMHTGCEKNLHPISICVNPALKESLQRHLLYFYSVRMSNWMSLKLRSACLYSFVRPMTLAARVNHPHFHCFQPPNKFLPLWACRVLIPGAHFSSV